jgi:hypothetical protein
MIIIVLYSIIVDRMSIEEKLIKIKVYLMRREGRFLMAKFTFILGICAVLGSILILIGPGNGSGSGSTDSVETTNLVGKFLASEGEAQRYVGQIVSDMATKKYYFPWCQKVSEIATANIRIFKSELEAKRAGYTPGSLCYGLNK